MIAPKSQDQFVTRAAQELQAEGARVLFDRALSAQIPEWLDAWDAVLVNETPGAAGLFAFIPGDGTDARQLQTRVDDLTAGLAGIGVFRGAPIALMWWSPSPGLHLQGSVEPRLTLFRRRSSQDSDLVRMLSTWRRTRYRVHVARPSATYSRGR